MTKQEITTLTNKLIQEGKLDEALESLSTYVKGHDRYLENDLLLQTASFNRNSRDYRNNLISRSDFDVVVARLNRGISQIIDSLPEKGNKPEGVTSGFKKILFLTANPKGTVRLRVDEEYRRVKESLEASTVRDQFQLLIEPAVKVPSITKAMQVHNPQVVHFSGHGKENGIMVEDNNGNPILFPIAGLDRIFKNLKDEVKCVVLNACFSKEQASTISEHGIYVVGMNSAVEDDAAISFALGFYQSLGEGNNYDFAFEMAMVNISAYINNAATPELWLDGRKVAS